MSFRFVGCLRDSSAVYSGEKSWGYKMGIGTRGVAMDRYEAQMNSRSGKSRTAGHASTLFLLACFCSAATLLACDTLSTRRILAEAKSLAAQSIGDKLSPLTKEERAEWARMMGTKYWWTASRTQLKEFIADHTQVYSRNTRTPLGAGMEYTVIKGHCMTKYIFREDTYFGKLEFMVGCSGKAYKPEATLVDKTMLSSYKRKVMGLEYSKRIMR